MKDLTDFMDSCPGILTEYREDIVRQLIDKITVYDDRFRIEFKAGLEIEVEA